MTSTRLRFTTRQALATVATVAYLLALLRLVRYLRGYGSTDWGLKG